MDSFPQHTTRMVNLMEIRTETVTIINNHAITPGAKEPGYNGEWIDGEFVPIYDELSLIDQQRKSYFAQFND